LFHLGNVRAEDDTNCRKDSFETVAEILEQSPVPVLVLPGNKDWSECPNPEGAFESWMEHLNRFEERFDDGVVRTTRPGTEDAEEGEDAGQPALPVVERHLARDENFAILLEDILIIGIHLIDGTVGSSERDWALRHQEDVQWVEEQLSRHRKETHTNEDDDDDNLDDDDYAERNSSVPMSEPAYRAVVILGHAPASDMVKFGNFFGPIKGDLAKEDIPVLYLHANVGGGAGVVEYTPFPEPFPEGVPRMKAAEIPVGGGEMGILKVSVGSTPFFKFE